MTFMQLLSHTPLWVFLILALGLFLGIRGFFTREAKVATIFILPLVFIGLSLSSLLSIGLGIAMVDTVYGLGLALGVTLGWYFLTPVPVAIDKAKSSLTIRGSAFILVIFMLNFGLKYWFGVTAGFNPLLAHTPLVLVAVFGLAGIFTGITIGRNLRLLQYFRRAADPALPLNADLVGAEK